MAGGASTMLKILACGSFGAATALFIVAAQRLMGGSGPGGLGYAGVSMRRAEMRKRALAKSRLFAFFLPMIRLVSRLIDKLGAGTLRSYIRAPYAQAGYPGGMDDNEVVATGFLLGIGCMALIGFVVTNIFGPSMSWVGLMGLPVGFLVLVSSLKSRATFRQNEILRALPYALDLIVLILRAGTSLSIALARVVADYSDHPLGDELGQVLAEINMGSPRSEAFQRFADRLKIPDISSFADSVVQSEELGWPLAETLERLADRASTDRVLRAQASAGSAGVLVMLPSTLVLMAAVLLLLAPMILRLMQYGVGVR